MNNLISRVKTLLANGDIDLFIGYEQGTRRPRPVFVTTAEEAGQLICNEQCTGNLAVYLTRKDLTGGKKTGVLASYYALKSICRLHHENQLDEKRLVVLVCAGDEVKHLATVDEMNSYLEQTTPPAKADDDALMEQIDAMSPSERWEFWTNELSKCFKCYACRSACPMCYCTKCIVENNRPQWIQPWAATISNMEWQINRVMHLAGRCVDCGSCGTACPLGLPVHILTHKMMKEVKTNFGEGEAKGNVLSVFKPEDKETFIL